MSMSVDIYVYDRDKLYAMFDSKLTAEYSESLKRFCQEKAIISWNNVIIQNCDYRDTYCPHSALYELYAKMSQSKDTHRDFETAKIAAKYDGANADERRYDNFPDRKMPKHEHYEDYDDDDEDEEDEDD